MARYTGPKNRLARREGIDLGLKTVGSRAHTSLLKRIKIRPGQHGQKLKRKHSDYSIQLREKQKLKRIYGILERQFKKYFDTATRDVGNTGEALLTILERRLDNVLFRLNLAPTRMCARQLISHGHILLDGKKVNIPSYLVKEGMMITIKPKSLSLPVIKKLVEDKNPSVPNWLARKGPFGNIVRLPKREDIQEDINEQLIIEFYSR
ncbi:30S ribosomal protein S4 [Candidatus Gottesmanbacteria bacterium RBG_13_37_7]|uniref:Small ribosomal subunit protein uS4 n=1 Tax=Candidatus Gottesmanbacteria bacterium RBG_13_37_7 TaxID=1798369 RepID=A0A1F5YJ66_9BACT|nr:MAG: 30S ribosomal protein S4 [Candidatus Gottesmanbacteria bacterium RBG_13_37_7]